MFSVCWLWPCAKTGPGKRNCASFAMRTPRYVWRTPRLARKVSPNQLAYDLHKNVILYVNYAVYKHAAAPTTTSRL